jgi:acetoin utilization deacetylase AcuC-like enzyme
MSSRLTAVERAADVAADCGATALVLALGVDAAVDDPESPLQVTVDGYRRAGDALAALGLPAVVVQEWLPSTDAGPVGRFGAGRRVSLA